MRLLLTSAGVTNPTIGAALTELLGKPIGEASALCIPTAGYANPGGLDRAWNFIAGRDTHCPMTELGWRSLGVLELTALPSLHRGLWEPAVRSTDAILVNGGDPLYLAHWLRASGLADLLPALDDTVWVGLSAGSMVLAPRIGEEAVGAWQQPSGDDRTLGVVDFAIFPHLDHPALPENTTADAEQWAANLAAPAYALDDASAVVVHHDGRTEVVSEGAWRRFD